MISLDLSIDRQTMDQLDRQLDRYSSALGRHSETASRRAAIMICKSLRSHTKPARKNKRMLIIKDNGDTRHKYISKSHGARLDVPHRRYQITLTDRGLTLIRYADPQKARQQLRKDVGTNYKPSEKKGGVRGLAKMSWGWVMHKLFGHNPDLPFDRRNNDSRSPKDATRDSISSSHKSSSVTSSYARICNRLDYIVDALKGYTPQLAIDAAIRWMQREIDRISI